MLFRYTRSTVSSTLSIFIDFSTTACVPFESRNIPGLSNSSFGARSENWISFL